MLWGDKSWHAWTGSPLIAPHRILGQPYATGLFNNKREKEKKTKARC